MANPTDVSRFLQAVFPDYKSRAIFAHSLAAGGMSHTRTSGVLDGTRDCYWSIAAFPDDKATTRTLKRAEEVRALVIDDVGTKVAEGAVALALGAATAVVETSAGNHQWVYRLQDPVPVAQWGAFFAEIERLVGQPLEGRDAVHLFRLPMGVNTKPGRGSFHVKLAQLNPGIELRGVVINTPIKNYTGPSGGSDIRLGLDDLRTFMGWIPTETFASRDAWVDAGHDIKALCADDEDGFTVFDEWSEPEKVAGYNRATWDELGASGLRSTGGMLKGLAQTANPDGFAKMFASKAFDDGAAPPPPEDTTVPRVVAFRQGAAGQILSTMDNAARALWGLRLECRYDAFHHRFFVDGKRLTDHMLLMLRVDINTAYGKDFGDKHTLDAVTALGLKDQFNPVTEMLATAEKAWDGVKRLDRLGPDYFHTEDSALARACFRKVMLAAVRRARRPGCKFDQILVLESPEGWDKSTAWAVLAGEENFSDAGILGKDARAVQEELADVWIHEIADLSGLARAEVEAVKAFASRQVDRARPAYGKVLIDQPRQSIEVGTTNSESYLLSQTGNRRFWPFSLSARVDTARLRADRLLLWGEAAAAETAGETLVLPEKLWGVAAAAQEDRRVVDVWEDELANLPDALVKDEVDGYGRAYQAITNVAIHEYLGGHRGGHLNGASGRKIAEIMQRLGWEKAKNLKDAVGKEVRGYKKRTDSVTSAPTSVPKNLF